jgi:hypothetical protein
VSGLPREVPQGRVIVAIDPGKVVHRVWVTDRDGLIGEPVSVANSRGGIEQLDALVGAAPAVFAIEATGALHRPWAAELERRHPGRLRLFAPSETVAARSQLGSRRFKSDDRDCAALVWLARQGAGRPATRSDVEALAAAVAHRRQLVLSRSSRCASGCMTSSTRSRRACRPREVTVGGCGWTRQPGGRCWPAPPRFQDARRRRGPCKRARMAA